MKKADSYWMIHLHTFSIAIKAVLRGSMFISKTLNLWIINNI